ncbi:MAG: arginine--tRNA ligase [Clostridia bacterium]|nr:arginine--tRNA ligase [Clostridia bacterium]
MDFLNAVAAALAAKTGLPADEIAGMLETPPNPEMGDLAFPCFRLARSLKKAPPAIAAELAASLRLPEGVAKAEAAGPYVNFRFDRGAFAARVLARVFDEGDAYGGCDIGAGGTVCVEFSSINIAKPFSIAHLPSTAIGHALNRIYRACGYQTVAINHLGDWGTQFGKMIVAYKKWAVKPVEESSVRELVKLYVRFHEEAEKDASLNDEARAWFKKIECGEPEAMSLWDRFKTLTLREVGETYALLGVNFDSYAGESFYEDKMQAVIDELEAKGLLKTDQGAKIVDLSAWNMPPCIIVKSDGATLYATRDLAAAIYRKRTYDFEKSLYVVAYQQNLHFQQFFKVLELMGKDWVKDCVHVNFGMVSMEEGTLSTRHGNVVYLEDVLRAAIDKTREIMAEKSPELEDPDAAARSVGVGAVIWNVLYNSRIKDIVFSWDKMLSFDGETGPYAQYTHARACSVLRRARHAPDALEPSRLDDDVSAALLAAIAAFPAAVREAMEKNEPYLVARQVIAVCQAFNRFYYERRIMADEPAERNARLALTEAARQTIRNGLYLIGLEAPERM